MNLLTIAKLDRYDLINTPGSDKPAFTVWFSGCSMACEDCHNRILWDKETGNKYKVETVLFAICKECEHLDIDTVVLLGGEPLEQEYSDFITFVQKLSTYGYKIWLYTGWEFEQIPNNIKSYLSTIKCGHYDKDLKCDGFPSSSNQRLLRKGENGDWTDITQSIGGR